MVIDYLPDTEPLSLVQKLLTVNALVNTAVVSPLSDEEFHEASEGLGILGRLPEEPGIGEASRPAAEAEAGPRKVIGATGGLRIAVKLLLAYPAGDDFALQFAAVRC